MATAIINSQMDAINESFEKISSDLTTIRPLLKNASIGAYPTDSASGAIASFTDGADNIPVKELKVNIEPIQNLNGQSSPYPAGGGTNIYDDSAKTSALIDSNGGITSSNAWYLSDYCAVPVGTTKVTLTWESTSSFFQTRLIAFDSNKTVIAGSYIAFAASNTYTHTYDIPSTATFVRVNYSHVISSTEYPRNNVRLNVGSTDLGYAPYSNICPISGHTKVNLYRTGKNLFDSSALVLKAWNGTGANATRARLENAIQVPVGTRLTFSRSSTANYVFTVQELDADYPGNASTNPNHDIVTWLSAASYTWTTTHPYVGIIFRRSDSGNITLADLQAVQMQIELGSTATDYEPYAGQTYNVPLGQTVYGGTLDVATGVLAIDMIQVDMGDLTWGKQTNYFEYRAYYSTNNIPSGLYINDTTVSKVLCGAYSAETPANTYRGNHQGIALSGNYITVGDKISAYASANDFKTAMSGVQIVYALATPTTVQLTPTQVSTLLGQNNIWADAGEVSVVYRADTGLYIDKKLAQVLNA